MRRHARRGEWMRKAKTIGFLVLLLGLLAAPARASDQKAPAASAPILTPKLLHKLAPLFDDLKKNCEVWIHLTDPQVKALVVERYVDLYRRQGVRIRKPARHYVPVIDAMLRQNPDLVYQPMANIVRMAAIIEYDFDNGLNPDVMARQVLGPQGYWINWQRLQRRGGDREE